ncbi:hypothetical protein FOZ62_025157, partial [Perkinsus olseni]
MRANRAVREPTVSGRRRRVDDGNSEKVRDSTKSLFVHPGATGASIAGGCRERSGEDSDSREDTAHAHAEELMPRDSRDLDGMPERLCMGTTPPIAEECIMKNAELQEGLGGLHHCDSWGTRYFLPGAGLHGITNLGNTCYMNAALQCLLHTPFLSDYFLDFDRIKLNLDNPMGSHGEVAREFHQVCSRMWATTEQPAPCVSDDADERRTKFPPLNVASFKAAFGRFAPEFDNYSQQDAQEFLVRLLDALHEDTNLVKWPKP